MQTRNGTIQADGAKLYYQTVGDGTPVLILQGGLGEAGATDQLAGHLSGSGYLVISHDRRGISRSTVQHPTGRPPLDQHAADAAAILHALDVGPTLVVGASIGALIGLHLAINHPAQVSLLVAHEAPMPGLVRDPQREADLDRIEAMAATDVLAAIQLMGAITGGGSREVREPDAASPAPVGDLHANLRYFFAHDFPAVRSSSLTAADVKPAAQTVRVVPTGGVASREGWEHRCAAALAEGLGRPLIELPGGHNGLVSNPRGVAGELLHLFRQEFVS